MLFLSVLRWTRSGPERAWKQRLWAGVCFSAPGLLGQTARGVSLGGSPPTVAVAPGGAPNGGSTGEPPERRISGEPPT